MWAEDWSVEDAMKIENINGYIVVQATVNDRFTGRFLLDTGADITVVTPSLAEQLNLQTIGHHTGGVAGGKQISIPLSEIQTFSIDRQSLSLNPIAIVDLSVTTGPYGAIDGIIGSDFLREFPLTIDYQQRELRFEDKASLATRRAMGIELPLILKGGTSPFLEVRLNDSINCEYKLDTGAGTTQVPTSDLALLGITEEDDAVVVEETTGLAGTYSILRTTLDSFVFGIDRIRTELEVKHLPVQSYECNYGFIGANALQHFTVTLNYKGKYVIVERSTIPKPSIPTDH